MEKIINSILENPVTSALLVHFFSSLFVAFTNTPNRFSKFNKIYRVIEMLALAIGKAKEKP